MYSATHWGDICQSSALAEFTCSRTRVWGLELLGKMNREIREIKHRNTEQHRKGNTMNIEFTGVYFLCACVLDSKRGGEGQQTSLI